MSTTSIWTELLGTDYAIGQVDVAGWRTRVLTAGSGPVVVLMHGTGGHLEAYARNIAALADHFSVVAYDYPGHGFSQHAHDDLEIPDYLGHLDALLDTVGASSAHLVGESLGGWVAVKFAAVRPDRVQRIVLNTPGGTMASPEVMERIRGLSQAAADDPSPEHIRTRLEWLMANPASVTAELIDVRRTIYGRPGFADSMRHILCLQDPDVRRRNMITDDELASITSPALVVWTSDDPSGPARAGLDMAAKLGCRFELIAEAGHWPQWEQSEIFNSMVIDFLTTDTNAGDATTAEQATR